MTLVAGNSIRCKTQKKKSTIRIVFTVCDLKRQILNPKRLKSNQIDVFLATVIGIITSFIAWIILFSFSLLSSTKCFVFVFVCYLRSRKTAFASWRTAHCELVAQAPMRGLFISKPTPASSELLLKVRNVENKKPARTFTTVRSKKMQTTIYIRVLFLLCSTVRAQ